MASPSAHRPIAIRPANEIALTRMRDAGRSPRAGRPIGSALPRGSGARGTTHVRDGEVEDVRVRRDAVRQVEHVFDVPDIREDRVQLFGVVIPLPGPRLP